MKKSTSLAILIGIAASTIVIFKFTNTQTVAEAEADDPSPIVSIVMPDLTNSEKLGQMAFDQYCMACHGKNAVGQVGVAPPLIHKIYEPSHHPDAAFHAAAEIGVRQHHWPFGHMPRVEGISKEQVSSIINFIRKVQRANGIN